MERTIIDSVPGSPAPSALFEPHMPGVDVLADMDARFAWAREKSAGDGEGAHVVIVTPGRMLMETAAVPPGSMPERATQAARAVLRRDGPLDVAVISCTRLDALLADETKTKCIPFFGHLMAFAYLGHRVVVFEGHPTAFEAGVRGADLLLVDSGMLPFLQDDWAAVAFRVMREGARILVHQREGYALLPVVKANTPQGWRYTEPDGEGSYANCLLTTLAGVPDGSVTILAGAPLPDLARVARDPAELEWIASLPFDYARLNAEQVMAILLREAKPVRVGLFRREQVLKARLARNGGLIDVAFRLTPGRTAGRQHLQVDRM